MRKCGKLRSEPPFDYSRVIHARPFKMPMNQYSMTNMELSLKCRITIRAALAVLFITVTACSSYKPVRVVAPELFGLTCFPDGICLDDPARHNEAAALTNNAKSFVDDRFGPAPNLSRVLYCSTKSCFSQFGNPQVAALYVWGTDTLVVNETGWQDYIIRHELIHHWQAKTFGVLPSSSGLPRWYIEGMAYVLSDDPRADTTNAEANGFRDTFQLWIDAGNDWRIPPE